MSDKTFRSRTPIGDAQWHGSQERPAELSDAVLRIPTFVRCCRCANGFEHEQKSGPGVIVGSQLEVQRRQAEQQALSAGWSKEVIAQPTNALATIWTCQVCRQHRVGGQPPIARAGGR